LRGYFFLPEGGLLGGSGTMTLKGRSIVKDSHLLPSRLRPRTRSNAVKGKRGTAEKKIGYPSGIDASKVVCGLKEVNAPR